MARNYGVVWGVMTKRVIDKEKFASWHYKNDPKHIVFFAEGMFEWLDGRYGLMCELFGNRYGFFVKIEQ